MSEFKNCPFCGRLIAGDATVCKHCGKALTQANKSEVNVATAQPSTFTPSEAFSYMFTDKTFMSKAIIIYIISAIATILVSGFSASTQAKTTPTVMSIICFIIGFLVNFILMGYVFSCTKAITNQNNNYTLPCVEPMQNFITGIKFFGAIILIELAFGLLLLPCMLLMPFIPMILRVILGLVLLFFVCKYVWVSLSFYWLYAHKNYLTVFFKYKSGKKIIANSKGRFGKGILYLFLYGILSGIAYLVLSFTGGFLFNGNITMAGILSSISGTYFSFVFAFIYAKMINPECVNMLE